MMTMVERIIVVVFRLFNFGVLFGLFGYLFKKYAFGIITQQMADKKAAVRDLRKQQRSLTRQKQEIERATQEQEQECVTLRQKIGQWKTTVEDTLAAREQNKKLRIQELQERMTQRIQYVQAARAQAQVLPRAIEQAVVTLQKQFTDEHAGRQFVKPIIDYFKSEQ